MINRAIRPMRLAPRANDGLGLGAKVRSRSGAGATLARCSLSLDIRGFHNRPPALDLGLVMCTKAIGCLLLGRGHILAEFGKPLAHGLVSERLHYRRIEPGDHVLRRAF